jgi:hypothetical protein
VFDFSGTLDFRRPNASVKKNARAAVVFFPKLVSTAKFFDGSRFELLAGLGINFTGRRSEPQPQNADENIPRFRRRLVADGALRRPMSGATCVS